MLGWSTYLLYHYLSLVAVMGGFQSWVGFGCGLVDFSIGLVDFSGFATMGNGLRGRMARWRSTSWVSRLVRSAMVGFSVSW